ncbi:MAG: hypothetical protein GYB26_14990 [Gammaproteobacteria bacterium]|nr:hypothetical protein [Gammaproteobacteria bacterium]
MKAFCLIIAYLVAVTFPLILSASVGGPPRQFHQELASGLGILAFSMVLMEFILSGRYLRFTCWCPFCRMHGPGA